MIEIGIEANLLNTLLKGKKTIEGRLRTSKFVTLRAGDTISFRQDNWENDTIVSSKPNVAMATVTSTKFYDGFSDMLDAIDYRTAIPNAKSKTEALSVYRGFYSREQEAEYGVVAIEFKLK